MKHFRHSGRLWAAVLLSAVLLGMFFPIRAGLRPTAMELAKNRVSGTAARIINDAVAEELRSGTIRYDRIISCETDGSGRICALKTNLSEVNRLKTGLLERINREILTDSTQQLWLPLGSLCCPALFSGKGPEIPVRLRSIGHSDAACSSQFTEAGINQTCHRLTMHIRVDVTVLVMGKTETVPVTTDIVVAETILVGDVPHTLIQTGGNEWKRETRSDA